MLYLRDASKVPHFLLIFHLLKLFKERTLLGEELECG
jgi:hypothetical protein